MGLLTTEVYTSQSNNNLKRKYTMAYFAELKKSFLLLILETVTMKVISPHLVLTWDQT